MTVSGRARVPIELQLMCGIRLGDNPHLLRRDEQAFLVEPSLFTQPCEHHDICIRRWPEAGGKHGHALARTLSVHADRLDLNSKHSPALEVQRHHLRRFQVWKW